MYIKPYKTSVFFLEQIKEGSLGDSGGGLFEGWGSSGGHHRQASGVLVKQWKVPDFFKYICTEHMNIKLDIMI